MSISRMFFQTEKKPRPPRPRILKLHKWYNLDYIQHEVCPYLMANMYNE